MYTHFGVDFADERGRPVQRFVDAMTTLAGRNGWFAPVSEILDRVARVEGVPVLDRLGRAKLEARWIVDRLRDRSPIGPTVATHDRTVR
jgi:hypothetical protein